MTNGPFPTKDAELNSYFQTAVPYVLTHATRLLVSADNIEGLTAELDEWKDIFPQAKTLNIRTATIVMMKNSLKVKLMNRLRDIYADVPASVWTPEDRVTLNIDDLNAPETQKLTPSTRPIGLVDTSRRLTHTIFFKNQDGTAAKPKGVLGCQIWYKIGEPATDPSEMNYIVTDTASPYTLQFNGEHAGKNAYYRLRWENTRGETGPWSEVVMAAITG